jgi:peptide/nickel transport system ATP-binding protein
MSSQADSAAKALDPDVVVSIENLTIDFREGDGWLNVVDAVNLSIRAGTSLGLVGESGCGKTTTAYAMLGYRRPGSRIRAGSVRVLGRELLRATRRELEAIRGRQIGFVPQNPTTALNPRLRIEAQLDETLRVHDIGGSAAARRAIIGDLIEDVGLSARGRVMRAYPHQLSGGQQQRVMIALALACGPQLLVLDEPTTGLDVTTQAQILDLLARLRAERNMALLYVTHDLGVVAEVCERVCVMYAGHVVEEASTRAIFDAPRHPYTRGLIAAVPSLHDAQSARPKPLNGLLERHALPPGCRFAPRCDYALPRCFEERQLTASVGPDHDVACWRVDEIFVGAAEASQGDGSSRTYGDEEVLRVEHLNCSYDLRAGWRRHRDPRSLVVTDVSLEIHHGETLALVGESGSGKSTIARVLAGLMAPTSGSLTYRGEPVPWSIRERPRDAVRSLQLILQNPDASLNPRRRVEYALARPLKLFFGLEGRDRASRVRRLLDDVRLHHRFSRRFPAELSGGERQRVAIARALAAQPSVVLCDEVLSALDVSVQAEILDLMRGLQERDGMAYLFISHDLHVVRSIAHRVAVLYRGELCEVGLTREVFEPPFHPYTAILLASVPGENTPIERRRALSQQAAAESTAGAACPLVGRCAHAIVGTCEAVAPPWRQVSPTHAIRCHLSADQLAGAAPLGGDPQHAHA